MRRFTKQEVDKWFNKPINKNRKEFFFLQDILEEYKVKRMAEIGVWKGALTRFVMENCPDVSEYWAIDPWRYMSSSDNQMDNYYSQLDSNQWDEAAFDTYCIMQTYPHSLNIIRLSSVKASELFTDEYFDCVFIDGDHSFDGVSADLIAWYPKVKKGKLICGDDIHRKSVRKAIQHATPLTGLKYITKSGLYWIAEA